jgi:Mycoplasma protein of unknown function, DUF285
MYFLNPDSGSWVVSNLQNMTIMFWNATSFNQDLGDVSNVKDMSYMFYHAEQRDKFGVCDV